MDSGNLACFLLNINRRERRRSSVRVKDTKDHVGFSGGMNDLAGPGVFLRP